MSFTNEVEVRIPDRSAFNLSHKKRMSMQFDFLYPSMLLETLPGDKFKVNQNNVCRFAPFLSPAFGDLKLYTHYFYVPRRIVEPFWKEFYTGEENNFTRPISYTIPYANCASYRPTRTPDVSDSESRINVYSADGSIFGKQSLADYLGIKPLPSDGVSLDSAAAFLLPSYINAITHIDLTPFIAYQYIYNEYYRDSQIDEDLFKPGAPLWYLTRDGYSELKRELFTPTGRLYGIQVGMISPESGKNVVANYPEESFNLGRLDFLTMFRGFNNQNPDSAIGFAFIKSIIQNLFTLRRRAWYHDYFTSARQSIVSGEIPIVPVQFNKNSTTQFLERLNPGDLYATSTNSDANVVVNGQQGTYATNVRHAQLGFTISALRLANAIQKFEEKSIRFGLRYIEQLASHFGVISSDASLQRPQFLGGSQSVVYVNEVTQTSQSTNDSPLGDYGGHAVTAEKGEDYTIYSEEHGWLFALTSVMVAPTYGDGLHKMWTRNYDRFNFYSPEFATLTDQTIKEKELFLIDQYSHKYLSNAASGSIPVVAGETEFGYAPRWDEYRGMNDSFSGQFRDKLQYWHFPRKFNNLTDLYYGPTNSMTLGDTDQDGVTFKAYDPQQYTPTQTELDSGLLVPITYVYFSRGFEPLTEEEQSDLETDHFIYVKVPLHSDTKHLNSYFEVRESPNVFYPPVLDSAFVHSHASLAPFALSTEMENIGSSRQEISLMGDDYIYCNFDNEVLAVRPLPEQILPQL